MGLRWYKIALEWYKNEKIWRKMGLGWDKIGFGWHKIISGWHKIEKRWSKLKKIRTVKTIELLQRFCCPGAFLHAPFLSLYHSGTWDTYRGSGSSRTISFIVSFRFVRKPTGAAVRGARTEMMVYVYRFP